MARERLSAGTIVLYWDEHPNGYPEARKARVVRARGRGVLVSRMVGERRALFRIGRGDVVRVVTPERAGDEAEW